MRRPETLSVLLTLLGSLAYHSEATSVNFRTLPNVRSPRARTLSAVRAADTQSYGFENLDNNNVYVADILVGGVQFSVQLDTGSSDTWVDTSLVSGRPLQGATDTGVGTETCYYDTTCANGNIWVANVTFGDFIITQQAIIDAAGSNATYGGEIQGLMGLGPSTIAASTVVADLANRTDVNSDVFIDNVLRSHPETDNYMTFLLSRSESGNKTPGGIFTIGEAASGWDAVHNATKLPVVLDDSWSAVIDGFVVNGVPVTSNPSTIIPEPQPNQLLALFDTGTTRAYAPMEVVNAIYGDVPGAIFNDDWDEFTLPCDSKLNVSVIVGGKEIPIHPIDTVILAEPGETERTDRNASLCVGAFSAIQAYDTDVILGDTFLRNAYTLFNFGSWTRPQDDGPYIQILGTTNQTQAFAEYDSLNAARLAARATEIQRVSASGASRRMSTTTALSWTLLSWAAAVVLLA